MSGSMNGNQMQHLDYREAFVLDMEMVAHQNCKQCIRATLNSKPQEACDQMKHMREYVKRAYEALPLYYKRRYEDATKTALQHVNEAIKEMTSGR